MHMLNTWRRGAAALALVGLAALLSACFLSPGKFDARLDLKRDGTFRFTYQGQIYLLALSQLAEMGAKADATGEEFVAQPCYSEDEFEERECTAEELEQQQANWEAGLEARLAEAERESQMMSGLLGGIDPADPQAAEELAAKLRRQEGWRKVEYKGDGLFEVDFAIESRLGHDFAFPTFESFPMANFFVLANRRSGNVVRIDAPAFAVQPTNPAQGFMSGMFAAGVASEIGGEEAGTPPVVPELDGTFTIVTDGEILANNTDEGPVAGPGGQSLTWKVNKRTQAAPTALIRLAP